MRTQMVELFDRDQSVISRHIANSDKPVAFYSLDVIIEFLNRNNALFRDGHKVISDGALVAITLMIAESDPKEKDIMTTMVMNLLSVG